MELCLPAQHAREIFFIFKTNSLFINFKNKKMQKKIQFLKNISRARPFFRGTTF
jgi:hypothetical protein